MARGFARQFGLASCELRTQKCPQHRGRARWARPQSHLTARLRKPHPGVEGLVIEIQLSTEPWEQVDVDAFVCPVNSSCVYSNYPASRIKELSGLPLEKMLQPHTPLAIGAAFVTEGGKLRAKHMIHVPNTAKPGEQVQVEDIARATAAVIVTCELKGYNSVAVPLMGAFETGIPAEEAARAIHSEFRSHRGERPARVLFVARNSDESDVFEMAIEGLS